MCVTNLQKFERDLILSETEKKKHDELLGVIRSENLVVPKLSFNGEDDVLNLLIRCLNLK